MKKIFQKNPIIFVLIIFVLLSFSGIFYNYPLTLTVGDEIPLMASALKMISYGTLRPAFSSAYTMTLASYLYLPFYLGLLAFLRISGLFTSLAEIERLGILDYGKLLPMARFISVLLSAVSVYLVYKICQKIFNKKILSLIAAFFLATNLMFIQLSHFGRVWSPQIFIILLSFYFIIDLYQKERSNWKEYLRVAILIGLSLGTHLVGVLIYLPFLTVHYLKNKKNGLEFKDIFINNKNFWLCNLTLFAFLPIIYYLNPYAFNNYSSAFLGLFNLGRRSGIIESVFSHSDKIFYLKILWEYEPILLIIFALSAIWFFIKERRWFYVFFSFIFGYYFLMDIIATHKEPRYIFPIVPFMAIISAYGFYCFYQGFLSNQKLKIIVLVILGSSFLYLPVVWDYRLIQPSTRILALNWIYQNLPSGAKIVNLDPYLTLNKNRKAIENLERYNPKGLTKKDRYLLALDNNSYPQPNYYLLDSDYFNQTPKKFIKENDFRYLIVYWWNSEQKDGIIRFIKGEELNHNLELVINFYPSNKLVDLTDLAGNMRKPFYLLNSIDKTGPYLEIYKINL